jgi:hypothetical protein
MSRVITLALIATAAACAHNVRQDKATGEDGVIAGAEPIKLVDNRGSARGIVTYPGGDRIDWKVVELPADATGTLVLTLGWTTPRPKLELSFEVFDQFNRKLDAPTGAAKSRVRSIAIPDARGKYHVRIFAVRRRDAGRYQFDVELNPKLDGEPDWSTVGIAKPPPLPTLPTVVVATPCDLKNFDADNPSCLNKCPAKAGPDLQQHPGCKHRCLVVPADPSIPACAAATKCNRGALDRRVPDCLQYFPKPCPNPANPDPNNPNCDGVKVPPQYVEIKAAGLVGGEWRFATTLPPGVDATWIAELLSGGAIGQRPKTDTLYPSGTLEVVKIDGRDLVLRSPRGTIDKGVTDRNRWVRLRKP